MKAKYISRRTFRYGQDMIYPGQEWKPRGGKHDEKIIRNDFVRMVTEPDEEAKEVADDQIESRGLDEYSRNHRSRGKRQQ